MAPAEATLQPRRLRVARLFSGMTQAELADRLEVAQPWVGQVEVGTRAPSRDRIVALAEVLDVRPSFFLKPLTHEVAEDLCHFRRHKTSTATARHQSAAAGTLFSEVVDYLETQIDFPPDTVPGLSLSRALTVEAAAIECRKRWGLSVNRPIGSMTRAVENAGVVVTRCEVSEQVDAFSYSAAAGRKLIMVNDSKGATRTRFDVAHELAHLVLHGGKATGDDETEAEANRFASAFLMPAEAFAHEFPRGRIDWNALVRLKQRWGVSLAAMVMRAHELGALTAVQKLSAYKYISWQGWRKKEPAEPALEQPESVRLAFEALAADGVTFSDVAAELDVGEGLLARVMANTYLPPTPPPEPPPGLGKVVSLLEARRRRA